VFTKAVARLEDARAYTDPRLIEVLQEILGHCSQALEHRGDVDLPGLKIRQEPLPGERLKSPGFEARCFRAAAEAGPVDVVIPLSVGSKHGDAELRYALRSIERYVENLGQVWIVGHRPTWLRGVEHIPAGDPHPSKDVNIIHKLLAACQAGVSERFVFWSDDQILLRPLAWSQLGPYTWRDLAGQPANGKRWHRRLLATRDWLASRGLPTWHCDTHVPIPMERSRFLELADAARDVWESGEGVTVGTWYCNQAAQPRPMGDRKATIEARLPTDQLHAAIAGRWFLGHNDAGFTSDLWALLDELFPDRCRFEAGERAARILVKPPGPSPSVIVPTISQPI